MRPSRVILLFSASVLFVLLLLYTVPTGRRHAPQPTTKSKSQSGIRTFFSFHTPLFPPSAIISLTDDNSTFFLARPAAFGPSLPNKGMSGQVWIGSGFSDDLLGRGGLTAGAEGELGCGDLPGWQDGEGGASRSTADGTSRRQQSSQGSNPMAEVDEAHQNLKRRLPTSGMDLDDGVISDGTDDHLADSVTNLAIKKLNDGEKHADIQSLQESAEIQGKVVLLSRGGCGFLEKVMWAQRRGAAALIVGDDVVGGPLVTMYAKGDTSNVTIPALFTSHTTAHLLSSLIPSGSFSAAELSEESLRETVDSHRKHAPGQKPKAAKGKPGSMGQKVQGTDLSDQVPLQPRGKGWIASFFSLFGFGTSEGSGRDSRPPNSGRPEWVQMYECEDCNTDHSSRTESANSKGATSHSKDDFVIGVEDWRDPDLLRNRGEASLPIDAKSKSSSSKAGSKMTGKFKGGSTIPGSGEYHAASSSSTNEVDTKDSSDGSEKGWLSRLSWKSDDAENESSHNSRPAPSKGKSTAKTPDKASSKSVPFVSQPHEGLWVTLTPTNMSSSPFFDTLLVLVVSPLVTLTVVYALLLLRSRIRRRRWRAPKSVVEQLPVRTYHTLPSEASSTALATPAASSPTTPLLQSSSRRGVISRSGSRTRLRSYTTSEVPESSSSSPLSDAFSTTPTNESEKRESGLAEWRRRYGGRQKECVVCLEEYIDGISQVLTLPCGHEFHQECITPWLVTRRRTCPICKGDVVRSMTSQATAATASSSTSPPQPLRSPRIPQSPVQPLSRSSSRSSLFPTLSPRSTNDITPDAIQAQAALARNDSPSAALPMPSSADPHADLEQGRRSPSPAGSRFQPHRADSFNSASAVRYPGDPGGEGVREWLQRNVFGGFASLGRWNGWNTAPRPRVREPEGFDRDR